MPPAIGSTHRAARRDSGAARMWEWAASRRKPWSTIDLGAAVAGSPRRIRAIVAAWLSSGLVERVREAERQPDGTAGAAAYVVVMACRGMAPPVMIVRNGSPIGARLPPTSLATLPV